MMSYKTWIYHATKAPKIIDSEQFEEMEALGWADTPAKFIKTTDFKVDPSDSEKVQALGEAIEGVKDAANGALNIDSMDKNQLEDYARVNFDVELDKRRNIKKLRKQVKELVGA